MEIGSVDSALARATNVQTDRQTDGHVTDFGQVPKVFPEETIAGEALPYPLVT